MATDPALAVEALLGNEFEPVTIDQVSVNSAISTEYRHFTITKVEVSVDGGADLAQGGDEDEGCLIAPELCEEQTEPSLDALLSGLATGWRNDDLAARLVLPPGEGGTKVVRRTAKQRQTYVVHGERELEIEVR